MTFSPDGRRIATGGDGHEAIKLWDVATRRELATLESQGSRFNGVRFSPDGNSLLAGNDAGTLHLWRAPSFAEIDVAESRQP